MIAFISVLITILRCLPAFLKMVKLGTVAAGECHDLIKWFFKHKLAGEKKLYVAPERIIDKTALDKTNAVGSHKWHKMLAEPLKVAETYTKQDPIPPATIYTVSKEDLHELATDGDPVGKTPLEVELEEKWR